MNKTMFMIIYEFHRIHVLYYVDLNEFLIYMMEVDGPFGGIKVILAGNF